MHTLLVAGSACGKQGSPRGQVVVPAAMVEVAPAATGTIFGRVYFSGAPPVMPEIGGPDGLRPAGGEAERSPLNDACGTRAPAAYVSVKDGVLADAVVRLQIGDLPGGARRPADPVVIDQKGCRFTPHVAAIVSGQKLAYRNSDAVMHDVRTSVAGAVDFHDASRPLGMDLVHDVPVAPGDTPYEVRCNAHPWMEAHVLVGDQPIHAVTGPDGKFALDGVPAGQHGLEVWHPHLGKRTTIVTVEAGKSVEAVFAPYQARDYQAP